MIKKTIRKIFNSFNYSIRKYPNFNYDKVNVFELIMDNYIFRHKDQSFYFIQVGAHDGLKNDPINRYIKKYNWCGILVEPQENIFNKLKINYKEFSKNLTFENIAISPVENEIELFSSKSGNKSTVASVIKNITKRQLKADDKELQSVKVKCMTLNDLINKHGVNKIDLLQIDTEGYDFEVIKTLDLEKLKPKLIHFEFGHLSPKECNDVTKYLSLNNYIIHWGAHEGDTIAILKYDKD
jgi:FkbM family methyltransferase